VFLAFRGLQELVLGEGVTAAAKVLLQLVAFVRLGMFAHHAFAQLLRVEGRNALQHLHLLLVGKTLARLLDVVAQLIVLVEVLLDVLVAALVAGFLLGECVDVGVVDVALVLQVDHRAAFADLLGDGREVHEVVDPVVEPFDCETQFEALVRVVVQEVVVLVLDVVVDVQLVTVRAVGEVLLVMLEGF